MCFYCMSLIFFFYFFFNDTATTEIYTLSLHDALPTCCSRRPTGWWRCCATTGSRTARRCAPGRSEEHTSELQSQSKLVCRLLLEKKKTNKRIPSKTRSTPDHTQR